jgi:polyisoprenyl-phosphate glycosyltransferase
MLRFAFDAITGFSVKPLRFASWLGLSAGLGGLLVLIYVLAAWLTGQTVSGWTSLMVVTLIVGSCQLLMIGIVGEYLGRLYVESKGRPLFVIDTIAVQPAALADAAKSGVESAASG